mmetsp:Transcript_97080/g.274385  ORF Transcript_97080/g.274385 Transcript_97080/m.274385 type:complete len:671 (-) Transcript_97080:78-2090(-)
MEAWDEPAQPFRPTGQKQVGMADDAHGPVSNQEPSNGSRMSEGTTIWQWEHRSGFRNYAAKASERIEEAYWRGDYFVRLKTGKTGDVPMELFFREMIQHDPITLKSRRIRRIAGDNWLARFWRPIAVMVRSFETGKSQRISYQEHRIRTEDIKPSNPSMSTRQLLKENGFCRRVVTSRWFSAISCFAVCMNALWIAVEAENNPDTTIYSSEAVYQVFEHLFCIYFTLEIIVRFCAFKEKHLCIHDTWFMIDSFLVVLTIIEVWVLTIVLAAIHQTVDELPDQLSLLRLLRLGRISRLLRFFPEMLLLLKGIARAVRSVFSTLLLLLLLLIVFGIIFKSMAYGDSLTEMYFGSVGNCMWYLLVHGTFLDDVAEFFDEKLPERKDLVAIFVVFIFLSSYTVMNMLIGILCDVVSQTSRKERENAAIAHMRDTLLDILECHDKDEDGHIQKEEFELLMKNPEIVRTLTAAGVDIQNLKYLKHVIFDQGDVKFCGAAAEATTRNLERMNTCQQAGLSFNEFIEYVFRLRGTNSATVSDIVYLREYMRQRLNYIDDHLFYKPYEEEYPLDEGDEASDTDPTEVLKNSCGSPCDDGHRSNAGTELGGPLGEIILARITELSEGQRELRDEVRGIKDQFGILRGFLQMIPNVSAPTTTLRLPSRVEEPSNHDQYRAC